MADYLNDYKEFGDWGTSLNDRWQEKESNVNSQPADW